MRINLKRGNTIGNIIIIFCAITSILCISIGLILPHVENEDENIIVNVEVKMPIQNKDSLTIEKLEHLIEECKIEHPQIVLAQIKIESGNLTSGLTKKNNNFLGMKHPRQRPTTSLGEKNGFANFLTWKECIYDYMIWQSRYAKKLTTEEYYIHIGNVYAQDSNYVHKLKKIVNGGI